MGTRVQDSISKIAFSLTVLPDKMSNPDSEHLHSLRIPWQCSQDQEQCTIQMSSVCADAVSSAPPHMTNFPIKIEILLCWKHNKHMGRFHSYPIGIHQRYTDFSLIYLFFLSKVLPFETCKFCAAKINSILLF